MIPDARDIPLTEVERDILSALRAAATRIPAYADLVVSTSPQHQRNSRRHTVGSGLVAAGIAITIAGGGYAAAAATGVLPNPWSGPVMRDIPFVTSPDPVATVKLVVPAPASTTIEIVNNTVTIRNTTEECTGVVIKELQGRSEHPMSACGGTSVARAENSVFDWKAPSGVIYAIINGAAPADATEVALTDRSGTTATEPTVDGYFVAYAPTQEMPANGTLDFYNSSGQIVGSQSFATQ